MNYSLRNSFLINKASSRKIVWLAVLYAYFVFFAHESRSEFYQDEYTFFTGFDNELVPEGWVSSVGFEGGRFIGSSGGSELTKNDYSMASNTDGLRIEFDFNLNATNSDSVGVSGHFFDVQYQVQFTDLFVGGYDGKRVHFAAQFGVHYRIKYHIHREGWEASIVNVESGEVEVETTGVYSGIPIQEIGWIKFSNKADSETWIDDIYIRQVLGDSDSDGDGIVDEEEWGDGRLPRDTDGDELPDYLDIDSDGDLVPDKIEFGSGVTPRNTSGTGLPDYLEKDSDGDGIGDALETDLDGDGMRDRLTLDENGDLVPDLLVADSDGDEVPDYLDLTPDGSGGAGTVSVESPMALYPLSTDVADVSGNNKFSEIVVNGDFKFIDDRFALDLAGLGYLRTDNDLNIPDVTVSFMVNLHEDDSPAQFAGNDNGDYGRLIIKNNGANNLSVSNAHSDFNNVSNPPIEIGKWHRITATWSESNTRVFVDNAKVGDWTGRTGGLNDATNYLFGGSEYGGQKFVNGAFADIIIVPRELSEQEVMDLAGQRDFDGDGIPDWREQISYWGEGFIADRDLDGIPDFQDLDSDNDGILDLVERGEVVGALIDTDVDGTPDYLDLDSNGNGISDVVFEGNYVDTDLDGIPNVEDEDDDNDGLSDLVEAELNTSPVLADTDGDGLTDFVEVVNLGTSPLAADSDLDGMPDSWEVEHGLDPNRDDSREDRDLDFLTNYEEFQNDLSPVRADTDLNGVSDHRQLKGTAPWTADYDRNDRLISVRYEQSTFGFKYDDNGNLIEQFLVSRDTDDDGLPDAWEIANGTNPYSSSANDGAQGDPDLDNWTNGQEWNSGNDPIDGMSQPGVTAEIVDLIEGQGNFEHLVLGSGQLDGSGSEEIVLGIVEETPVSGSLIRVYTYSGSWSHDDITINGGKLNSLYVGAVSGGKPAIYTTVTADTGTARLVEYLRTDGIWRETVIVESASGEAVIHGARTGGNGNDLVVSLAVPHVTGSRLFLVSKTSDGWRVRRQNSSMVAPVPGDVRQMDSSIRTPEIIYESTDGSLKFIRKSSDSIFDDFDGVMLDPKWTEGFSSTIYTKEIKQEDGRVSLFVSWGSGRGSSTTAEISTNGFLSEVYQAAEIKIDTAYHSQGGHSYNAVGEARVGLGLETIFTSGVQAEFSDVTIQILRVRDEMFSRFRIGTQDWSSWTQRALSENLIFWVTGGAGGQQLTGNASMIIDEVRYIPISKLESSGKSNGDISGTNARYLKDTGKWYIKLPEKMGWSEAEAFALDLGCDLISVKSSVSNDWLKSWNPNPVWLGLWRSSVAGDWSWLDGGGPSFSAWIDGGPTNSVNDLYASSSGGQWISSSGLLKHDVILQTRDSAEQWIETSRPAFQDETLRGRGGSFLLANVVQDQASQLSAIRFSIRDSDTSGTVSTGDRFELAEYTIDETSETSRDEVSRDITATAGDQPHFTVVSRRASGESADTLITGDPDGQVGIWNPRLTRDSLERDLLSTSFVGKYWYAMDTLSDVNGDQGVVGVLVSREATNSAEIVLIPAKEFDDFNPGNVTQSPARVVIVGSGSPGRVLVPVDFRMWDSEGQLVNVRFEYQDPSSEEWKTATVAGVNGKSVDVISELTTSVGGESHKLLWRAEEDLGPGFSGNVLLRMAADDPLSVGKWSFPTSFNIGSVTDSDLDGMSDEWESLNGLTVGVDDAQLDLDWDGRSNLAEFFDETIPNDGNSAKYSLVVDGVGATVEVSPEAMVFDAGTEVTLSAQVLPGLAFMGWAPTELTQGGDARMASSLVNPRLVTMNSDIRTVAYAGLSLADSLDTSDALNWSTGGTSLWYGENVVTSDGADAVQAARLAEIGDEAWLETTVAAPGELSWKFKLNSGGGTRLELMVDGVVMHEVVPGSGWTESSENVTGSGDRTIRWRFFRESISSNPSLASAFIDQVVYTPRAIPDAFTFTDVAEADLGAVVVSDAIVVAGLNVDEADVSIVGGDYSLDNGTTWVASAGVVSNGQSILVRLTSSADYATPISASLTIGEVSDSFDVTTLDAPTRVIGLTGDLAFGDVLVGSAAQRILTINNSGNDDLAVAGINFPAGFSGNWSTGVLAPDTAQEVTVVFSPTAEATYDGEVTVSSDATSGTAQVAASGNGAMVASRIISIVGELDFGRVTVGGSAQRPLTISNQGNAPLTVAAINFPDRFSSDWSSGTIGAGVTQQLSVTFAPTAAQNYGSSFTVLSDATSGAESGQVSGEGFNPGTYAATHSVVESGYIPGGNVTVTNTFTFSDAVSSISWSVLLPTGWSYVSSTGMDGNTKPVAGATDLLEWVWHDIPASPFTFTYTLKAPESAQGDQHIDAVAAVRFGAEAPRAVLATPDPLVIEQLRHHTADTDQNFRIGLIELTRVIELYNTRFGTNRTGAYRLPADGVVTEDGFEPDYDRAKNDVVALARYHAADSDRDGKIGLIELTRVIELYNFRSGTTRTGQYHLQVGTEDGYAPGP